MRIFGWCLLIGGLLVVGLSYGMDAYARAEWERGAGNEYLCMTIGSYCPPARRFPLMAPWAAGACVVGVLVLAIRRPQERSLEATK